MHCPNVTNYDPLGHLRLPSINSQNRHISDEIRNLHKTIIIIIIIKKGGMAVLEWLVRLLNVSFDMGVAHMDCRGACIVPRYKWKGDKCECSNSRGISLLRVVGKLYGRVLIKRVRARTECAIGEEQCVFTQCRGCIDQVFAVRQVCEKYLANGKDVFWAFMDLEMAYDAIDRHGMWQMLRVYGVGGKLLKAVQSFYVDSRAQDV